MTANDVKMWYEIFMMILELGRYFLTQKMAGYAHFRWASVKLIVHPLTSL